MNIEEAKEILKCCMNDDCTKCEYADVFDCVKKHNEAIETVLEELENKQDDINILQAQRDSMEYQFKQAVLTLEHKDQVINLMALAILNYDDQLVINKYKDINDVKETFEEILKEKLYD